MVIYWDDLSEGKRLDCRLITFTVQEIVEFAEKFDPQPFHIDEEAAAASRFRGIIASSLHTLSACTRAIVDAQQGVQILIGFGMHEVKLPNPVYPGDILTVEAWWAELRRSASKPEQGLATARFKTLNQKGEIVMESGFRYMIACRR